MGELDQKIESGPDRTELLLILRRCRDCGKVFAPPAERCVACMSRSFGGVAVSGAGSIVCWRMLACPVRDRAEPVLRAVAIVELDEGPWVYAVIDGKLPAATARHVPVRFRRPASGDDFPVFSVVPSPVR